VVKNDDYRLQTERLNYRHKQRLIFTDDPVRIEGEAANLKANTLRYELSAGKIVLTGNVAAALSANFEPVQALGKP
jgi:lipopolysaccharide export system protein LptC